MSTRTPALKNTTGRSTRLFRKSSAATRPRSRDKSSTAEQSSSGDLSGTSQGIIEPREDVSNRKADVHDCERQHVIRYKKVTTPVSASRSCYGSSNRKARVGLIVVGIRDYRRVSQSEIAS